MKKILYLTLCFVVMSTAVLYSQNTDPKPLILKNNITNQNYTWEDTTVFSPRKLTNFTLGWQWAGPNKEVNKALHITTYQNRLAYPLQRNAIFPTIADSGGTPRNIIWGDLRLTNDGDNYGLGGISMHFDPTAPTAINETTPVRTGDTTGAIFGFTTRNTTIGTLNPSGVDFDRYTLNKNAPGLPSTSGITVLSHPVKDDNYVQSSTGGRDGNGHWYIAVNLRRSDTSTLSGSDKVLTIKVPYELANPGLPNAKDSIVFDSVAVTSSSGTNKISLSDSRGLALKLQGAASNQKELVITRDMLPVMGTTGSLSNDITISAFFRFRSTSDPTITNPSLKKGRVEDALSDEIVRFGIDVLYHGNLNVAIDWLRFETPFARELFRGEHDSILKAMVEYNVQIMRDSINPAKGNRNIRLQSFYGIDEPPMDQ